MIGTVNESMVYWNSLQCTSIARFKVFSVLVFISQIKTDLVKKMAVMIYVDHTNCRSNIDAVI